MNPWRQASTLVGRFFGRPAALLFILLTVGLAWPLSALAVGTWSETGHILDAHIGHTATLLADGRVLVAGGKDIFGFTMDIAVLFDPATGRWTATGSMVHARSAHTANLLTDGRVLVAGGWNGVVLDSAELYDPATGTWSATGSLAHARDLHTATRLTNGRVLVVGGYVGGVGELDSVELFNPATGRWSSPGPLITARAYHTATLLADGRVLVAGGQGLVAGGQGVGFLASAELLDPSTMTWSATGPLGTARESHTATLLADGRVLVVGGQGGHELASAELFNPGEGTWSATTSLLNARVGHTATLLADGRVLVAGGYDGANYLSSSPLFQPTTETWTTPSMILARAYHKATRLADGRVLVAGGKYESAGAEIYLLNAELYDPQNYIRNGSFEAASVNAGVGLDSGSNAITGWQVGTGGGVNYRGTWQSAEGNRCLDLNYLDAGSIFTSFSASKGKRYLVTFALAGNPGGVQGVKTLRVSVGSQFQDFTFDTTGKSTVNMGWTTKSWSFKATDVSPILQFRSLTDGTIGPALDKVRVIRMGSVPLSLLLLE